MKDSTNTAIVVFGATGDLSRKKLLPALARLYESGNLPENVRIVGFARRDWTDKEFRKFIKENIIKYAPKIDFEKVRKLVELSFFQEGDVEDSNAYKKLAQKLHEIDDNFGWCLDKFFYLSVSPRFFGTIFDNLSSSGLTIACSDREGWTRILVEKPFGKDSETAMHLDRQLGKIFREEQIYRIDHYIAKETVQNILTFRFSNLIFEPIWNKNYIEKIEIKMLEDIGVEQRGSFFDEYGALRDVGQNHLLQMLAFVAMESPGRFDGKLIRRERASILGKLVPINEKNLAAQVVRGQYAGYKESPGISKGSKTETYFKIKAYINSIGWKGVPFYLESGKNLAEKKSEINVYFKEIQPCFCPVFHKEHKHQNVLTFKISPTEDIQVRFWARQPGFGQDVEARDLSFSYRNESDSITEAYEQVLSEGLNGKQMLFTSTEEVENAWKFITPIIENWNQLPLYEYEKGSSGPNVDI